MEEDKSEQQKQQMAALSTAAQQASEIVRRSRDAFEKIKKQLLRDLGGYGLGGQDAENFSSALDAVFGHGHNAGENSQTSLAVNEQLEMMGRMLKESSDREKKSDERDKRIEERDKKAEERSDKTLELLAKQNEILENISSAIWEIAKPE
jgi:hypothetical protein